MLYLKGCVFMNTFKDAGHLFRLAAVFVIGGLAFVGVRALLVPKSFGQYGHYRGDAPAEIAARPVNYAGHQACEDCHSDVLEKKKSGRHVHVPAAAVAWKSVLAGTPEESPNYKMSDHWWGMLIDIPSASAAATACAPAQTENDVPDGFFRTWVERYHVSDENMTEPEVIRPTAARKASRPLPRKMTEVLLRPQDVQPLRGFALHAGLPGGRHLHQPGRRGAGGPEILPGLRAIACRPAPTAAATSIPKEVRTSARSATTGSPRG
jgi:hypothetical protein